MTFWIISNIYNYKFSNSILNSILIHNLCPNSNLSNDLSTISATYRHKYELVEILSRALYTLKKPFHIKVCFVLKDFFIFSCLFMYRQKFVNILVTKVDLCFDFSWLPKARRVVSSRILSSVAFGNHSFGIPTIFEKNFIFVIEKS